MGRWEDAIENYARNPLNWAASNKEFIANQMNRTVPEVEALIAARVAELKTSSGLYAVKIDLRRAKGIEWLYIGRIPAGKLVILDGDPAMSKSMFSLGLGVSVMTGQKFLGLIAPEMTGGVVLCTAEDDLEDTVMPRLIAAGHPRVAPENLIWIPAVNPNSGLQMSFADPEMRKTFEEKVKSINAKLVVIDPLNAFLGEKVDSHNDQKIRQVLSPLSDMANRTGATFFCLRHLNKSGGSKAIYRGQGSIGYTAAARANFFAAQDPEDEKKFIVATSKFNLGPKPDSIRYTLDFKEIEGVVDKRTGEPQKVAYCAHGEFCQVTADSLTVEIDEKGNEKTDGAIKFLEQNLMLGPVKATELKAAAKDLGISQATLRRAAATIKVRVEQGGAPRAWYWLLEKETAKPGDPLRTPF